MNKFHTLLAAALLTAISFAQSPEKMSYQAVVRDSGDNLVASQAVGLQISILQGSATGTAVYSETQIPTTNVNGLVSIQFGGGTGWDTIDWSAGPYFIKTETDPTGGSSYAITGTSQLLSVPYALHAKTAESVSGKSYNVNSLYPELGGYVIEISDGGKHGLVVAMHDQGQSSWYEVNDLLSNANNHDTNGAKFKDWRLPTKRELHLIRGVKTAIGASNNDVYWSSTEIDYESVYVEDFSPLGDLENRWKYALGYLRAVRAF